jgi:hypothetical protein
VGHHKVLHSGRLLCSKTLGQPVTNDTAYFAAGDEENKKFYNFGTGSVFPDFASGFCCCGFWEGRPDPDPE